MRSDESHGFFFLSTEKRPFLRANETSLDDWLSKSLNLSNHKQFAKMSHKIFHILITLPLDSFNKLMSGKVNSMNLS